MEKIMKLSTSHLKVKDITGICNHQAINWYWHTVITLYPIIYIISTLLKREIFYVTYFPLYTLIININCSKKLTGTRDIYILPTTQKLIINSDTMSIIRVLEIRLKFLFSNLRQINRFYLPSLSKTCDISLIINLMLEIHQTMFNSGKVGTWIEQLPEQRWTITGTVKINIQTNPSHKLPNPGPPKIQSTVPNKTGDATLCPYYSYDTMLTN